MSDEYSRLRRSVASALAACDPLELADPAISLADEYESEAREIARRVLGAPAGSSDFQTVVQEVFVQQFAVRLSSDALSAIERAVAQGRRGQTVATATTSTTGIDSEMSSSAFIASVSSALAPHGWIAGQARGYDGHQAVRWTARRSLTEDWEAILDLGWYPRNEIEVSKWRRGMREVVFVDARVTYPRGDDLARAVGMRFPADVGRPVEVMFEAVGQVPGELQMRGQDDYARAAQHIDAYASDQVIPWALANASLKSWLTEYEQPENAEDSAWAVPVMLAAHGRKDEARGRLGVARTDPELAADPEFVAFAERLESFLETGDLPDLPPQIDPSEHGWNSEDPIRMEFIEGFFRERAEESVGAQLRFLGRKLRSGIRTLRETGQEGTETSWWAPVAVASDAEGPLDRLFEAAGPPVDHRVGLQVDLGGRGSGPDGGVEIRFGETVLGVLRPAEIPSWGVIPYLGSTKRARLTRKRDAPRFLLEVDIGS